MLEYKRRCPSFVFLDIFTLAIRCFHCKVEILNECFVSRFGSPILKIQFAIRELLLGSFEKYSGS